MDLEDRIAALKEKDAELIREREKIRDKLSEAETEKTYRDWGVKPGIIVNTKYYGIMRVTSVNTSHPGRPLVIGNKRNVNGKWSIAELSAFRDWELIQDDDKTPTK